MNLRRRKAQFSIDDVTGAPSIDYCLGGFSSLPDPVLTKVLLSSAKIEEDGGIQGHNGKAYESALLKGAGLYLFTAPIISGP